MSFSSAELAGLCAIPAVIPEIPVNKDAKLVLVTGGAGFVGSHVVDRLMLQGHRVWCLDNFHTGSKQNISHWLNHPNFCLLSHDITEPLLINVQFDRIYHLACPASPPHYQSDPIGTLKTAFMGTLHMLNVAKSTGARFLLSSTSEIYGDPQVHPQPETYWGNLAQPKSGPRACYDEGKRVSESLAYSYSGVDIRVARIFNTYGPRLSPTDGRVISNFLTQSIRGQPLTVYGDGSSSRSYQYIHDLVDGLLLLMESQYRLPINIGNPCEYRLIELANLVVRVTGSTSAIVFSEAPIDDPRRRRPDIAKAKAVLGWEPKWDIKQGILVTADWFRALDKDKLQSV